MQRIPKAVLYFDKYTDTQLIARTQQVIDGITGNVLFPEEDLPVDMETLQSVLDLYRTRSAAAIKGSKEQTAQKLATKNELIGLLRSLVNYVNSVVAISYSNTPNLSNIDNFRQLILSSGFEVSKIPTPVDAISGIPPVQVRRAISETSGTLKILVRQYTNANRNTLMYQVNYRTSAAPGVPAGAWFTQTFTGQNQIVVTDLTPGQSYDYQVAAIGGRDAKRNDNPPVNFTPIASVVII